jgi:hypothetical protein
MAGHKEWIKRDRGGGEKGRKGLIVLFIDSG